MTREHPGYSIVLFLELFAIMMAAKSARMNKLFAMPERSSMSKQERPDAYPTDHTQIRSWLSQNTMDQLDRICTPLHAGEGALVVPHAELLESSIATLRICQEHWDDQDDPEQQEELRMTIRRLALALEYLEEFGMIFWDYRDREENHPIFRNVQKRIDERSEGNIVKILSVFSKVTARRPDLANEPQPIANIASVSLGSFRTLEQLEAIEDEDTLFFLEEVIQRATRLCDRPERPIVAITAMVFGIAASIARRKVQPDSDSARLIARM